MHIEKHVFEWKWMSELVSTFKKNVYKLKTRIIHKNNLKDLYLC